MSKETIIKILENQLANSKNGIVEITDTLTLEIIRALFQENGKGY